MVAPVASQIMSEILPLLGVEPDYTAEELVGADTTVPNVVGQTREAAEDRLADLGFTFRTVGDGDTVTDQTPAGGAIVPGNASIILYLGQEKPDTPCTVPNVVGKSASEANKAITNAGLIMKVTGTTTASSGNVYAITQSLPAGTEVAAGHGGDRPVRRQLCPGLRKQVLHGFWHLPPYTLQIPLFIMRDGKLLPD